MNFKSQRGYTYFGVLFIVALIGLSLSGAAMVFQVEQQRQKERELLFVGQQYIDAISSYYHAAPGGVKVYPRKIEDLLKDPRYLTIKRHLRKPWRDPLTGKEQWELVFTRQGGIAGVYTVGSGKPLKRSGFDSLEILLANKEKYSDWRFIYIAAMDNNDMSQKLSKSSEDSGDEEATQEDEVTNRDDNEDIETEEETGEELIPPNTGIL